jgi:hypothetical protein
MKRKRKQEYRTGGIFAGQKMSTVARVILSADIIAEGMAHLHGGTARLNHQRRY